MLHLHTGLYTTCMPCAPRDQKRALDPWSWCSRKLWVMWVFGIDPKSFGRTITDLSHSNISPSPQLPCYSLLTEQEFIPWNLSSWPFYWKFSRLLLYNLFIWIVWERTVCLLCVLCFLLFSVNLLEYRGRCFHPANQQSGRVHLGTKTSTMANRANVMNLDHKALA